RVEREGRGEIPVPGTGEVAAADRSARVGHQVIEAAERGRDVVHGALQLGRIGDVGRGGGDGDPPGSQPLGGGGQAGRVPGDETHGRALGGERLGHREADTPAAPGDQRAATAQAKIHECGSYRCYPVWSSATRTAWTRSRLWRRRSSRSAPPCRVGETDAWVAHH